MVNLTNSISPTNSVVVGPNNTVCNTDYFTDQQTIDLFSQRTDDEISLLHINIRSIVKNYNNLTNYITNFTIKPDIIALSETKITEKSKFGRSCRYKWLRLCPLKVCYAFRRCWFLHFSANRIQTERRP